MEDLMSKKGYDREAKKLKRQANRSINDEERMIMIKALEQVINTTNTPDNFSDRFTHATNVFSILVHSSTFSSKKKELRTAHNIPSAVDLLREHVQLFFSRTKENEISTEEWLDMMKIGLKEQGLYPTKRKMPVKKYFEVGHEEEDNKKLSVSDNEDDEDDE